MSIVNNELINHLAHLSRLHFNSLEKELIKEDFEKMVELIKKLQEVNTDGVEPLRHMGFEMNKVREDHVNNEITQKEAFLNATTHNKDYFIVPKTIKKKI